MSSLFSAIENCVSLNLRKLAPALGVAVALLLLCAPLYSQGNTGNIQGTVTDQTGGAIAGATVAVTDVARGTSRNLTTDAAGVYNATNLVPSTYTVRVTDKGFKAFERQNIVLEVNGSIRIDATLQPGEQTQTVTVTEAVPLVETTNATLGETLQNTQINNLPLNGRNFQNLLNLHPGVQKYVGGAGWTISTNGTRPHDNMYLVNGIDSNDPWMAQSVMNAVMAAGDAGTMLPIDSIDEFKTVTNPPAQYGWKPGAMINVGLKSGTNNIHGTAYAYGRNGAWDARDYFNTPPAEQPPTQVEQFGASVGGPIVKDKAFYFGNFESQRYNVGNPAGHDVPITAAGVGTLTGPGTNNLIAACQNAGGALAPLSAQLAGLSTSCVPLGNYPGLFPANSGANGTSIQTAVVSSNVIWSGVGKVDYHINQNNTINAMYFISPGSGNFVDNATQEIDPQWITTQYARSQVFSTNWTWTPTSNWVNELRVGYSHYYQVFGNPDSSQNPANYTFNGTTYHMYTGQANPAYFGFPGISFQGGINSFTLGDSTPWPKRVGPDGTLSILDHISYLHGNHSFMFGGEIMNLASTNNVTSNTHGPIRFGSLNSFFLGTPNRARISAGNFLRHLSSDSYALFMQDDWRVKPRLTLNLGVRYELNTVVRERDNLIGNFDPTLGPIQVGTGGLTSAYNGDHNNFSPRVGIAWDMFGNGKTVLRAGGNVMYEQPSFDVTQALGNLLGLRTEPTGVPLYVNGALIGTQGGTIDVGAVNYGGSALNQISNAWINNGPNTPIYSPTATCGDGNPVAGVSPTPQPCTIMGVNRNLRTPYVINWMADVQRAITNNLSLDVAYVGNRGVKLLGVSDINQPTPGAGWGDPAVLGSPAQACVASATDANPYDNCGASITYPNAGGGPDPGLEAAAQPFAAKFPYLGYIEQLNNSGFSTYNGLQVSLTQRTSHGLSYTLGYTYSRSLGTGYDNWSFLVPINSQNPKQLYGPTLFDSTHFLTYSLTYAIPGKQSPAQLLEGWSINSVVTLQSGQPWGVNDFTTDFSGTNEMGNPSTNGEQWNFYGSPSAFRTSKAFLTTNGGAGGIPYFPGTGPNVNAACAAKAASLGALAQASFANFGCYAVGNSMLLAPAFGSYGTMGINPFRGPAYYNWDFSITKEMKFKERLTAQFRAEFFNILNHPTISNPFGGPGGDNTFTDPSAAAGASFGFRNQTPDVTNSNPVLGSGGPREIQLGLKLIF
jgi:Carboxypeptidase regulatory-like domain/TonB dependent receptor-like, beta-barrel